MLELNRIYNMDCLEGMKLLDDNSVDSIVTDPPYELGFMGKKWDSTDIAYNVELWKECLRVLKPGGHLLAFGGTRTYHRMTCAIEDAGFEIRDCIQWIYGTGFPKSHDISKAIDKREGYWRGKAGKKLTENRSMVGGNYERSPKGEPVTTFAKQWSGWGTALKPANEPIVVARKPLSEKTIAENVIKWGTGGLNIDGCRIAFSSNESAKDLARSSGGFIAQSEIYHNDKDKYKISTNSGHSQGRFPANVILDEEAGRMLDEQHKGASRFFYCAKASKKERSEGNNHPTVKPLSLIKYLITLVTPPGGICLDPFEGSGTHALACKDLGFNYIGFELDKTYYSIATKRISNITPEPEKLE